MTVSADSTTQPFTTDPRPLPEMRGLHAGLIVLAGVLSVNVGNYVFHLVAGRLLGPSPYSDVASLLALSGLISLPLGGAQIVISRYVAQTAAERDNSRIASIFWASLLLGAGVSTALALAIAAFSGLIQQVLTIESRTAVILTGLMTIPSVLMPVILGVVQGLQRFVLLSVAMVVGSLLRIVMLVAFIAVGFTVSGVIGASLLAGSLAVSGLLWITRKHLRRVKGAPRPDLREMTGYLVPVAVGLLAVTSLTTSDLVVAKAAFDGASAGIYGSASLIGRIVLYLPAAIVTVLLPKVSGRLALGRETGDILAASVGVTVAASTLLTLSFTLIPGLIVDLAFGDEFADAADLLWLFGIVMSLFAVLNVLLVYDLARGTVRGAWLLLAGAVVQIAGYGFFHDSAYELLSVSLAVAGGLIVLHEALEPALVRSLVLLYRGQRG